MNGYSAETNEKERGELRGFSYVAAVCIIKSVTRLGDLLDFGQLFKAFDNNQFAQISHIPRHFLKRCQYFLVK